MSADPQSNRIAAEDARINIIPGLIIFIISKAAMGDYVLSYRLISI